MPAHAWLVPRPTRRLVVAAFVKHQPLTEVAARGKPVAVSGQIAMATDPVGI